MCRNWNDFIDHKQMKVSVFRGVGGRGRSRRELNATITTKVL